MHFAETLRIEPIPCPRPRIAVRGRFAHAYYPASYKKWGAEFKKLFEDRQLIPFTDPVHIRAVFYITKPRTTKLRLPKGDIDNYAKALFDGLTSVGMWADDKLVAEATLVKRFADAGEHGRIELAAFTA